MLKKLLFAGTILLSTIVSSPVARASDIAKKVTSIIVDKLGVEEKEATPTQAFLELDGLPAAKLGLLSFKPLEGAALRSIGDGPVVPSEAAREAFLSTAQSSFAKSGADAGNPHEYSVSFTVGSAASPELLRGIKAAFSPAAIDNIDRTRPMLATSGSIFVLNEKGEETQRYTFTNAVIRSIAFEFQDGDPAGQSIGVTLNVAQLRSVTGGGINIPQIDEKTWLPANFRLEIVGLDNACGSTLEKVQSTQSDMFNSASGIVR